MDADELLSAPRGRRLCFSLATLSDPALRTLPYRVTTGTATPADLITALRAVDPNAIALDNRSLLRSLAESVDAARYWQAPDEADVLLSDPVLTDPLHPFAEALVASPAMAWWSTPIARDNQRHIEWLDATHPEPLTLIGSVQRLTAWKAATVADETDSRSRPKRLSANHSGRWWSIPSGQTATTRSLPELGAVGLALLEDSMGYTEARVTPVRPREGCRIYEITGPEAWSELAARYPLEVPLSRRHDWWRATGHEGPWVIPDWTRVADDFDAVHLSVAGYLTSSGRALPAADSFTVLAGWSPDETYWLNHVLEIAGDPAYWRRDESMRWAQDPQQQGQGAI